jgi:hypothetical protein
MPNSLRSLVVSSRNAILRRKPKPLQDTNFSLTGTADHDVDKNPSITHGQPRAPPLSTIASYGPVNNGELSSSTYAHPNFEASDTTSRGSDKKSVCGVILLLPSDIHADVDVVIRMLKLGPTLTTL